jgi:uncharacterized membrane protein YeiB
VPLVFDIQSSVILVAMIVLFVFEGWALIDAVSRRPEEFEAAGKQTKSMWMLLLGIAFAAFMITTLAFGSPINILNMAGAVAAIVYLVDVRPAIRSLTRR